ncbi:hypothetical protein [Legionella spiritensis]|uniref:Interaptin n=1 Tax=Legionella spiritensis TaxID=452 RepID=A0A0W0YX75_LEGSP|nr:hypothetical protein [Legionella spiritensis]KTD61504.1 interaptin [Legionella spiritensis]SNV32997.1 interaptin [Legionella spiritensis]
MAYQNRNLKSALENPDLEKEVGFIKALDDILSVDTSDLAPNSAGSKAFRAAVIANEALWTNLGVGEINGKTDDNDRFLVSRGDNNGYVWGADPTNDFQALRKLAAEKRVVLGLQSAGTDYLAEIIKAATPNDVRTKLIKDPEGVSVFGKLADRPGWNVANEDVITNRAAQAIQLEAQRQLVLKKIAACNDIAVLEGLLAAPAPNFATWAEQQLGLPHDVASLMVDRSLPGDAIEEAAAHKGALLKVNDPTFIIDPSIGGLGPNTYTALNGDEDAIRDHLGDPYTDYLRDEDVNDVRGALGKRFLVERFATLGIGREADLATIAAATNAAAIRNALAGKAEDGAYLQQAVTDSSVAELRLAAATQALKLKVLQSENTNALDALIQAGSHQDIKRALGRHESLGFSANNEFQNAFSDKTKVQEIAAIAHIRKSLFTAANPAHLRELITGPVQTKYTTHFNPGPGLTPAVNQFFTVPEQETLVKEQALIALIRAKARAGDDLSAIVAAGDQNGLQVAVGATLMGGARDADGLIGNNINQGLNKIIRAYAMSEHVQRLATAFDLNNGPEFAELLAEVNNLNFANPAGATALTQSLPVSEQNKLRGDLARILIDRYPATNPGHAPLAKLTDLAKAKDVAEFKQKLNDIGITNHDWVNEESRKAIQKLAGAKLFRIKVAEQDVYGAEIRTEILNVLDSLPLDKQQAVLAKPEVLTALMKATEVDHVRKILGITNPHAGALVNENRRLALIAQIANAKVAETLANMTPPVTLDKNKVKAINDLILDPNNGLDVLAVAPADATKYKEFLDNLSPILAPAVGQPALYTAFHLQTVPAAVYHPDATLRDAINTQHAHNLQLINAYRGLGPDPDKHAKMSALTAVMRLEKGQVFPNAQVNALLIAFSTANNLQELHQNLHGLPAAVGAVFPADWEKQITNDDFKRYQAAKNNDAWLGAAYNQPNGVMARQKTELNNLVEKVYALQDIEDGMKKELRRLGNLTGLDILNPAFMAAAKQKAQQLGGKFQNMADVCDTIVDNLRHQKALYEQHLQAMPSNDEVGALANNSQKNAIRKHRSMIENNLKLLESDLQTYERVSCVLHGDPNEPDQNSFKHKGLLRLVDEVKGKAKETDLVFTAFSNTTYVDYNMEDKKHHMGQEWKPKNTEDDSTVGMVGVDANTSYYEVDPIPAGKFREYTTYSNLLGTERRTGKEVYDRGVFLVEHGKDHMNAKTIDKKQVFTPATKVTITHFPKEDNVNERIKLSMQMATQLLAGLAKPPSKENPIVLRGSNTEELRHLWTALVVLGENNPGLKFDHSAIKVVSASFNPENELGKAWGFSGDSLYNQHYKNNPIVETLSQSLKDFSKEKAIAGKAADKVSKQADKFKIFKEKAKATNLLDEMKQENTNSDTTPQTGLGR